MVVCKTLLDNTYFNKPFEVNMDSSGFQWVVFGVYHPGRKTNCILYPKYSKPFNCRGDSCNRGEARARSNKMRARERKKQ